MPTLTGSGPGGLYVATPPSLTSGQRSDMQVDARGNLKVTQYANDSTSGPFVNYLGDATTGNVVLTAGAFAFNGATWDRVRTPSVFKTALATAAGDTAVWTPAAGKKFRLMRYAIYLTANASLAVAGLEEIVLRDGVTAIGVGFSAFVPGAAGTTFVADATSGWIDLGNGFLSAAANNVLNVNLGTALATGEVRVVCCGTEE